MSIVDGQSGPSAVDSESAWAPLREPRYRTFWLAIMMANVGVWMQNVGAGWLMATLTSSPLLISAVQFATSLPVFLLGLPAGFIADRFDRRRITFFAYVWVLVVDLVLAGLTAASMVGPGSLLLCTVLLGIGFALAAPSVQSIVVDLVPRPQLQQAIMLSGVSFNTARSVGPALAGVIMAWGGPAAVFAASSLTFAAMLVVPGRIALPSPVQSGLPAERLLGGMRAGLRYAWYAAGVYAALIRTVLFGLCAAAVWGLLPLIARHSGNGGAGGFGALVACLGVGAVLSAFIAARLRERFDCDRVSFAAALLFALTMAVVAWATTAWVVYPCMVLAGIAWALTLNTTYAVMQSVLPPWVRARCLALYLLLLQGAMALGSLAWGAVAEAVDVSVALSAAAAALVAGAVYARLRHPLVTGQDAHVTPVDAWLPVVVQGDLEHDDGPIAIEIEYRIDAARRVEFIAAGEAVGRVRRRDGAMFWRLYRDLEQPGCYRERFIVDSWAEYLRSRSRGTLADRFTEERFRAFHAGPQPPVVRHSIAER